MNYLIISCLFLSLQVVLKAQSSVSTVDESNSKNTTSTHHTTPVKKQTVVKGGVSTVDMSKEKTNPRPKTSGNETKVIINKTNSSVYIKPE